MKTTTYTALITITNHSEINHKKLADDITQYFETKENYTSAMVDIFLDDQTRKSPLSTWLGLIKELHRRIRESAE